MNSERVHPLTLSAIAHAAFAGLIALLFLERARELKQIDFEVIERPAQAPLTLRKIPKEKPAAKDKPRAVYGVSRKALTSEAGPEVKAGNTVAKAPDNLTLRPEDADSLPVPTEEYLVSSMPVLLSDFRVPYPPEARSKGIQGVVLLDLLIGGNGVVRDASVVDGPGSGLNEAALQAARQLRFKPAMMEEKPVAVRIRYAYRFVIER